MAVASRVQFLRRARAVRAFHAMDELVPFQNATGRMCRANIFCKHLLICVMPPPKRRCKLSAHLYRPQTGAVGVSSYVTDFAAAEAQSIMKY
ncbi:hypothetical protein KCP75_24950 [Salmonella enterica subsp. enterica]|nr:hypothetical protein KCP75_24950 [Salmonella enterica subsp. enterica]